METLYKIAWEQLRGDRTRLTSIDPEATPVLTFGSWRTARVVTAGLNPSEREFRDQVKIPLVPKSQRFLHWPEDGVLSPALLEEAFRRSDGYFTLGNAYEQWFGNYALFLDKLGTSFKNGSACHTDYLSPFATRTGISEHEQSVDSLLQFGLPFWVQIISVIPNVEVILGHGRGHSMMKKQFNFDSWEEIAIPFVVNSRSREHPFLYRRVTLPTGRQVHLFWWRPNLSGIPLSLLDGNKKEALAEVVLKLWKP